MSSGDTFGRSETIARLDALLEGDARLVTITGAPGVGKSHVVRRFTMSRGRHLIVDVTRLQQKDTLEALVQRTLELEHDAELEQAFQTPYILVLDGAEAHEDEVAQQVERWLDTYRLLTILVTSHGRLHLGREQVLRIEPLDLVAARELFVARAQQVRVDWSADEHSERLDALLEGLDRLPLAIELAASRAGLMSVGDLLTRLEDRFSLLRHKRRDAPERHLTLRAAIDWAWSFVADEGQHVLTALSIFTGEATLAAIEAILEPDGIHLDALQELEEASLVSVKQGTGRARVGMLESVRAFASERLTEERERELRSRHAEYYDARASAMLQGASASTIVEEFEDVIGAFNFISGFAREQRKQYHGIMAMIARLGKAADNSEALRSVLAMDDEREDARARALGERAGKLARSGRIDEATATLDDALDQASTPRARWTLTRSMARILARSGRLEEAEDVYERARKLAERLDDPLALAQTLGSFGRLLIKRGAMDRAIDTFTSCMEAAQRAEDVDEERLAWVNLGHALEASDRLDDAHEAWMNASAMGEGKEGSIATMLAHRLGKLALRRGEPSAAMAFFERERVLHRAEKDRLRATLYLARTHIQLGDDASARREVDKLLTASKTDAQTYAVAAVLAMLEQPPARVDAKRLIDAGLNTIAKGDDRTLLVTLDTLLGEDVDHALARLDARAPMSSIADPGSFTAPRDDVSKWLEGDIERSAPTWHGDITRDTWTLFAERALVENKPHRTETGSTWTGARGAIGGGLVIEDREHMIMVTPSRERVVIDRPLLRRLVDRLLEARLEAPGAPLTAEQMLEAGWPGEFMTLKSARSRLYAAIHSIRDSGLSEVLLTANGGYMLDPSVPVDIRG